MQQTNMAELCSVRWGSLPCRRSGQWGQHPMASLDVQPWQDWQSKQCSAAQHMQHGRCQLVCWSAGHRQAAKPGDWKVTPLLMRKLAARPWRRNEMSLECRPAGDRARVGWRGHPLPDAMPQAGKGQQAACTLTWEPPSGLSGSPLSASFRLLRPNVKNLRLAAVFPTGPSCRSRGTEVTTIHRRLAHMLPSAYMEAGCMAPLPRELPLKSPAPRAATEWHDAPAGCLRCPGK